MYTTEQLNFIRSVNGSSVQRKNPAPKEDLTVDGYINKYGSITSHLDNKNYTTKRDYMDHLKKNNCHIKDY
jgi:hypothetical protein